MEGRCSTGQSPQWAVVPMEEEEERTCRRKIEASSRNHFLLWESNMYYIF